MRYLRSDVKGYTLLEIILVLAILGMVITPISTFFISNLKAYNQADDQLEVQYQAQIAMNEFIDRVIKTKGIKKINNRAAIEFYPSSNKVKKVSFDNSLLGGANHSTLIFEHKEIDKLFYGYGNIINSATVLYANYIEELIIVPVPSGSTYENCSGIKITIKSKKGNAEVSLTNEVYFRN